jgi:hypothetical protein
MRKLVGALLRRMAERVDPKPHPKPSIIVNFGNLDGDLSAQVAAALKRRGRRGLA